MYVIVAMIFYVIILSSILHFILVNALKCAFTEHKYYIKGPLRRTFGALCSKREYNIFIYVSFVYKDL